MRSIAHVVRSQDFRTREKSIVVSSNILTSALLLVAIFIAAFAVSWPRIASATTISIVGTPAWVREADEGTIVPSSVRFTKAVVGTGGDSAQAGLAGLLFFELPDLSTSPQITSAELTVELTEARDNRVEGEVPGSFNVDLYFLGVRNGLTMESADYGDAAILPQAATLTQDDWWIANDDSQIGTSKSIAVDSEIQSAYTNGTPNDAFAVYALYGDIDFFGNEFTTYRFEFQGSKPDLHITSVPEPSTFRFCALGILSLASWRRWISAAQRRSVGSRPARSRPRRRHRGSHPQARPCHSPTGIGQNFRNPADSFSDSHRSDSDA